jgi:Icc-related predicted phosphoesterase
MMNMNFVMPEGSVEEHLRSYARELSVLAGELNSKASLKEQEAAKLRREAKEASERAQSYNDAANLLSAGPPVSLSMGSIDPGFMVPVGRAAS